METLSQPLTQIIQLFITLISMITAVIISITKLKQSKQIDSLKDEKIKLLEFYNSKENLEKLMSEITIKNNTCCELKDKIEKTYLKLKTTQEAFWLLIKCGILKPIEKKSKTKDLMKYLLLAFDYLIEINQEEVNEYETLKRDGSGLGYNDWKILIDSGLIWDDDQKYKLTSDGKTIFKYYKDYKKELDKIELL